MNNGRCSWPVCFRLWLGGVVGLLFIVLRGHAQFPPIHAVDFTNSVWRYQADGLDQGTRWRDPAFDDANWPMGQGLFGLDPTGPYRLPFQTPWTVGGNRLTYYLRTRFQAPLELWQMHASFLVDDGAVFYLNGSEAGRVRMPLGDVQFDTPATQSVPVEGVVETMVFPAELLVPGENVLAVEVHQFTVSSSDVVFGLSLDLTNCHTDIFLNVTPQQQTVLACGSATFALGPAPSIPVQWFRNGVILDGATNATLTLTNVHAEDIGYYSVVVTNICGTPLFGSAGRLDVAFDVVPLRLERAVAAGPEHIRLEFELALEPSRVDPFAFEVEAVCAGIPVEIHDASVVDKTNVVLTTSTRRTGENYRVTARGLLSEPSSCAGFPLSPDPSIVLLQPGAPLSPLTLRREGKALILDWESCGILQSTTNLVDWLDVPGNPSSPQLTPMTEGTSFYRLRLP